MLDVSRLTKSEAHVLYRALVSYRARQVDRMTTVKSRKIQDDATWRKHVAEQLLHAIDGT